MSQKTVIQTYKLMYLQKYFEHFKRVKWNKLAVNYSCSKIPKSFCCFVRCIVLLETFKYRIYKNRNVRLSSECLIHLRDFYCWFRLTYLFSWKLLLFYCIFSNSENSEWQGASIEEVTSNVCLLLSNSNWLLSTIRLK